MTVARALELPCVQRGLPDVLAGAEALDRPIRWVHVTEDPHVSATLKGGELMLSTGMVLNEDRRETSIFVEQLADRGVVGLIIELGARMPEIPEWLIASAVEVELPLICLRREVAFVEITEEIHSAILAHQLTLFQRGEEVRNRFAAMASEGRGGDDILAALAEVANNPVVLEDHRRSLLFHASHGLDDRDVIAAWEAQREGSGTTAAIEVPVPRSSVGAGGRLLLLGMQSPISEFDRVAADHAAGIMSLSLLRAHQDELVGARERGNFLVELVDGRLTAREAANRAQALGFTSADKALMPLAIGIDSVPSQTRGNLWYTLRRELDGAGFSSLLGAHARLADVLLVVALKRPDLRDATADRLAELIRRVASNQFPGAAPPTIAVGADCEWSTLKTEMLEACRTVEAGRGLPEQAWHDAAAPDLSRLLWNLGELPEMQRFVEKRLGPLIAQDRRRNTALIDTLDAYCRFGGRKTAAAEALHLRRQALHYRLNRIEEVLGSDLDDEYTRLGLHLALRIHRRLNNGGGPAAEERGDA
jgi:purine catabolism regulator